MSNSSAEDLGNRFSTVDDSHRGGILWIIASISLTYFLLSCILRIYLNYRQFGKDVISLVAATIFGFIQVMFVYAQLNSGYGTSIHLLTSSNILYLQKSGYTADLLFIIALTLSKISVIWFVARLTPNIAYLRLCTVVAALCFTWGVGSVFALALRCNSAEPWDIIGGKCTNLVLRWQLISAFDIATEFVIFAMIIGLVFNLRMAFKKKFVVVLGFAFRLPLIVLAIVHVHYYQLYSTSTNATFDQIIPSVIMSVQLGWSLISATIPCLKSFVANLGSGYLGATLNANLGSYANSGGQSSLRDGSYVLNKIRVSRPQETTITGGRELDQHSRQDVASRDGAQRVSSDGSQEFIIRRTVDYKVNYENKGTLTVEEQVDR